jgi:cytochrome c-type biogenesis protein CcmH
MIMKNKTNFISSVVSVTSVAINSVTTATEFTETTEIKKNRLKLSIISIVLYGLFIACLNVYAVDTPVEFSNPVLKERYYSLIEEVRCLVCQNQSLADSHADLAQDLRNEIYQMVIAGEQDEQIIKFLVERYGDFVLYRPPLQGNTWLLWFGPFVFLVIAIVVAIMIIRKQSNEKTRNMSEEEQQRLAEILNDDSNRSKQ